MKYDNFDEMEFYHLIAMLLNTMLNAPKGVVPDVMRPFYDSQRGAFTTEKIKSTCQDDIEDTY